MIFLITFGHLAEIFGPVLENHRRVCQHWFPFVHGSILKEQKFCWKLCLFSDLKDTERKRSSFVAKLFQQSFWKQHFTCPVQFFQKLFFSRKKCVTSIVLGQWFKFFGLSRKYFRRGCHTSHLHSTCPEKLSKENTSMNFFLLQSFPTMRVKFFAYFQKNLRGFVKTF